MSPTTTEEALALFDELPAVRSDDIIGRWKGRELATGHPMDGALAASGWYGKQFDSVDKVHPLLMSTGGTLWALEPRRVPLRLASSAPRKLVAATRPLLGAFQPWLRTTKYRARLRDLAYRGVVSASMIYDHLPIIDSFRRIDDTTLLGAMDLRHVPKPYFFLLERD